MYKLDCKKPALGILLALISYASIGALLFTPALPEIQEQFKLSSQAAQSTVTIFLVGYAIGPLLYGPMGNRFGRKKTLYCGVWISFLASIAAIIAAHLQSYLLLMWARFFMAVGASVGIALTFMIIADYYHPKQARKQISYTALAFAIVPALAIALGGLLVQFFGWLSCFYFLAFYAVFVFFLCTRLPETATELDPNATKISGICQRYGKILKNRRHLLFSLMCGGPGSLVYLFATAAPLIGIKVFKLDPLSFGLLNIIPYAGYFVGSFFASYLNHRLSHQTVFRVGYSLMLAGSLFILVAFLCGLRNEYVLFFAGFFIFLGLTPYFSNSTVLASEQSEDKSTASSWMSFVFMTAILTSVFIMSFFADSLLVSFPIIMVAWCLIMIILAQVSKDA